MHPIWPSWKNCAKNALTLQMLSMVTPMQTPENILRGKAQELYEMEQQYNQLAFSDGRLEPGKELRAERGALRRDIIRLRLQIARTNEVL